ncbi:MAG TPA: alpha/beta fold hydrolase [Candidatus Limnocylindrales bacterium]|nr:alpha/beta fold hydrolase [Candidatus Limnocylindrales bacterium]
MPDAPSTRPLPSPAPTRPVRKDEIELVDRGIYIESTLPERRSRRKPLLFVHGELGGSWVWERWLQHFAARGWEGHAVNLRNHYWSQAAEASSLSFESYTDDVGAAMDRLGPDVVGIGHGMGALLLLKALERHSASALVLLSPELPAELRQPAQPHELRDVPDVYGKERLGWSTLIEKIVRDERDLSLDEVRRIQHLLGQKPRESGRARRQVIAGIPVDRAAGAARPMLVVGARFDRLTPESDSERLAEWLGAEYEAEAHSHYGLLLSEAGSPQVAEAVRGFLEAHRL